MVALLALYMSFSWLVYTMVLLRHLSPRYFPCSLQLFVFALIDTSSRSLPPLCLPLVECIIGHRSRQDLEPAGWLVSILDF